MLPRINPLSTNAWKQLQQHYTAIKSTSLRELFRNDPARFEKYSTTLGDILFDYSKNIINDNTLQLLFQLANECGLPAAINAMYNGDIINETEHRSVLHVALRNFSGKPVFAQGTDVMPLVKKVQDKMKDFCDALHNEYRPPTQSQNSNMLFLSIPNFTTSASFVLSAMKCCAICFSSLAFFKNHCLAV